MFWRSNKKHLVWVNICQISHCWKYLWSCCWLTKYLDALTVLWKIFNILWVNSYNWPANILPFSHLLCWNCLRLKGLRIHAAKHQGESTFFPSNSDRNIVTTACHWFTIKSLYWKLVCCLLSEKHYCNHFLSSGVNSSHLSCFNNGLGEDRIFCFESVPCLN